MVDPATLCGLAVLALLVLLAMGVSVAVAMGIVGLAGMTDDEVAEFSGAVDIASLRAYCAAVGVRTRDIVRHLRADDLDRLQTRVRS